MPGEVTGVIEAIRSKALALGLVVAIGATGCAGTEGPQDGVVTKPDTLIELTNAATNETIATQARPTDGCIEPSSDDFAAFDQLWTEPEDPMADPYVGSKGNPTIDDEVQVFKQQVADQEGVTIFDATPFYNRLSPTGDYQADGISLKADFNQYLTTSQDFMEQYGVDVTVGTPDMQYSYGGRAPSAEELESDGAKLTVESILQAYDDASTRYVALSGLEHIVIMTGTANQDVGGYALTSGNHDTMFLDIEQGKNLTIGAQGILHETGHLLDAEGCGPNVTTADPSFVALNNGQNVYIERHDPVTPNLKDFLQNSIYYEEHLTSAEGVSNWEVVCGFVEQYKQEAAQVMTVSDYHPDQAEDKAEVYSMIADPNEYANFDERSPILFSKFRYLMARLYKQSPETVRYLLKIGRRSTEDPFAAHC